MRFLNVLLLALGVSSLLIPPQINDNTINTLELPGLQVDEGFALKCAGGCPIYRIPADHNEAPVFIPKSPDSELGVHVKIHDGKLFLNLLQVWPRSTRTPNLFVKQIVGPKNLGDFGLFSIDTLPSMPASTMVEYKQDEYNTTNRAIIHPISVEIMSVGSQLVKAERMEFRVVETQAGIGLLESPRILPYESTPFIDSCTNIWCRVRNTIEHKYAQWRRIVKNKVKGWHKCGRKAGHKMGHKGHKTGGLALKGGPKKFGAGSILRPHGHHKHRHSKGGFFNALFRVIKITLPPLILGFSIGMLIRVVLTRFAPHWLYVVQLKGGDYVEVKQSDVEAGRDSIDGPPKYEEVYGDEVSEKQDEKN